MYGFFGIYMIKNGNFLEYNLLQRNCHQCSMETAHCPLGGQCLTVQTPGSELISELKDIIMHF